MRLLTPLLVDEDVDLAIAVITKSLTENQRSYYTIISFQSN
ncbi:hypothetical protein [Nostoc sp. UHCC 0870]